MSKTRLTINLLTCYEGEKKMNFEEKLKQKSLLTKPLEIYGRVVYYRDAVDICKELERESKQNSVKSEAIVNFADILDDMIKELQTEQQTIQNDNRSDDWENYCYEVCDNQLKILYELRSRIESKISE